MIGTPLLWPHNATQPLAPRPEVSRTYNFGEHGSSKGQYFRTFLKPVTLASEAIDWASEDLSHLLPDE